MSDPTYPGGELELFAEAHQWKRYWITQVRSFVRGAVLEVGAGIGSNTVLLRRGNERRWVCLEPDPKLAAQLRARIDCSPNASGSEVRTGTIDSLDLNEQFDTILYIDVLEHIAEDRAEVQRAARQLSPTGRLVVLSPAHPWLFSPFDRAIGHYRRYSEKTLTELTPPELSVEASFYLDAVGLLASAANRLMLRQNLPTARQLAFWDNCLVPCSRLVDPITRNRFGKTVVCIWKKEA